MEKKNLIFVVLAVVLVGVLIVAINFMVKKYESESTPAPAAVLQPAPEPIKTPEPKFEEGQVSPQGGDSQFSTENGKLLR